MSIADRLMSYLVRDLRVRNEARREFAASYKERSFVDGYEGVLSTAERLDTKFSSADFITHLKENAPPSEGGTGMGASMAINDIAGAMGLHR